MTTGEESDAGAAAAPLGTLEILPPTCDNVRVLDGTTLTTHVTRIVDGAFEFPL